MRAIVTYKTKNGTFQKILMGRNDIVDKALWFGETHSEFDYKIEIVNQFGKVVETFNKTPKQKDSYYMGIINPYNGHNKKLVDDICNAWDNEKFHDSFKYILFSLAQRDKSEIFDKMGIYITSTEQAMDMAHEIMENVCDDLDLECILKFVRY